MSCIAHLLASICISIYVQCINMYCISFAGDLRLVSLKFGGLHFNTTKVKCVGGLLQKVNGETVWTTLTCMGIHYIWL